MMTSLGASQYCFCCETATLNFALKLSTQQVPADRVHFIRLSSMLVRETAL